MTGRARLVMLAIAALSVSACAAPPEPISVSEGTITILNQTSQDWKDVVVTVNDYFAGGVPLLRAEGRASASLSQLTTGHGQRWVSGTPVRKIEVKGTNADGSPVTLSWQPGQGRR